MSNYTKITDYAAKDSLITGDVNKRIRGTEIGAEFDAISVAVATKQDSTNIPSGGISATTIQGAINELDTETVKLTGNQTVAGVKTFSSPIIAASATAQTEAVIGSQLFSFRNKIINGGFTVSQRGTTGTTTASSYTADRWIISTTGTALSWNVSATSSGVMGENGFNALSWSGAASNTGLICLQRIESTNCRDLAGKTCTVSFWMYQSTGSSVSVTPSLVYSTGANDSWAGQTGISALDAATSVPSGTWTKVTNRFAVPSGATTGLGFYPWGTAITFGAGTAGYVSHVKLEEGLLDTPFEQRPYGYERDLCRRYLRIQSYYIPAGTAQNLGTIDMRGVPNITGGGAGFTSTGTTADQLIAYQTTGAVTTLTLEKEL